MVKSAQSFMLSCQFLGKKIGILNDNDDSYKRDGNGPVL